MRVLGGDETPLDIVPLDTDAVVCVAVPGFGHLMLRRPTADVPEWGAVVASGPGFPSPRAVELLDDGRLRVAMLHKVDRLDVIVTP